MQHQVGDTTVRWIGGGLFLQWQDHGFVLDAPPGVVASLGADLPAVRAIVLSGGRLLSVGGLLPLLIALTPHRRGVRLDLRSVLGEERGPAVAETWVRAWGQPYPLTLDGERPGGVLELGPIEVALLPMKSAEPDWPNGQLVSRVQVALRVTTPDLTMCWVPGAAPGTAVARACEGVDLAVLEVGVVPWPRSERPWRMSASDAVQAAQGAGVVWLVGDDGRALEATGAA